MGTQPILYMRSLLQPRADGGVGVGEDGVVDAGEIVGLPLRCHLTLMMPTTLPYL